MTTPSVVPNTTPPASPDSSQPHPGFPFKFRNLPRYTCCGLWHSEEAKPGVPIEERTAAIIIGAFQFAADYARAGGLLRNPQRMRVFVEDLAAQTGIPSEAVHNLLQAVLAGRTERFAGHGLAEGCE